MSPRSINAEEIESKIGGVLTKIKLPTDWKERVRQQLTKGPTDADRQREIVEKKNERLNRLYIESSMKEAEYRRMAQEYKDALEALPPATNHEIVQLEMIGDQIQNVGSMWKMASLEEKKHLAMMLFSRIYIRNGTVELIEPTPILWAQSEVCVSRSGKDRSTFNIFLPVKPLNSSIVYHFLNAYSLAPFITNPN